MITQKTNLTDLRHLPLVAKREFPFPQGVQPSLRVDMYRSKIRAEAHLEILYNDTWRNEHNAVSKKRAWFVHLARKFSEVHSSGGNIFMGQCDPEHVKAARKEIQRSRTQPRSDGGRVNVKTDNGEAIRPSYSDGSNYVTLKVAADGEAMVFSDVPFDGSGLVSLDEATEILLSSIHSLYIQPPAVDPNSFSLDPSTAVSGTPKIRPINPSRGWALTLSRQHDIDAGGGVQKTSSGQGPKGNSNEGFEELPSTRRILGSMTPMEVSPGELYEVLASSLAKNSLNFEERALPTDALHLKNWVITCPPGEEDQLDIRLGEFMEELGFRAATGDPDD